MDALGQQKADAAVKFLRSLRHVKDPWAGVNFTLLDWQERIVRDVYGTLKPDGTRRYKHVYVELPKKMGKSEWLAGLGLKQLCADDEWAAEVYGCAADREQASIIYDIAVAMVDQEPELQAVCENKPSKKRIIYLPTKSFYQVLSSEAFTKHGLNVSAVLFDEIHAQPNRELFDVMTFGSGDARRQPLFFYITTAGDDPARTSVGWEVHQKARDILLGNKVDPTWYPAIWGYEPEEKRIWRGWTHEPAGRRNGCFANCG
jgi:phage terminase large subunit-like protein